MFGSICLKEIAWYFKTRAHINYILAELVRTLRSILGLNDENWLRVPNGGPLQGVKLQSQC